VSSAGHDPDDLRADVNLAGYFLERNIAEGRGDRTALITAEGDVSYAQLLALTDRIGNVLLEAGVRREERVLLALADSLHFVAAWFAVQKIGGVTAEVYTFLQPHDYTYYLEYTRASAVVNCQSALA